MKFQLSLAHPHNLDGSDVEAVLSGLSYPQLLALDSKKRKIYWSTYASAVANGLYRSNLDGSSVEPLVVGASISPTSLLLNVVPDKMYWTNSYGYGRILRANLDGSDLEEVLSDLPYFPRELTFDSRSKKLFWLDHLFIYRANLDGSDFEAIADAIDWAQGLALDRGYTLRPKRTTAAMP